ncbi:hypothetical protein HUN33_14810 [Acinetobacter bereziniae]|uniref:hypothetical protein n=1 Tax=Acinetobacter bereziniae TaxID=106648 RepID=UPI00158072C5|nr:hypothetical protein [Acinetobacter bereziniae]NUF65011.1 hypothetical protein [Acinetobacter bereziniae]NUG08463.1 hypothetical protein [Acinetobacter bereziniae]NUG65167.1 hypothetical protein [Acinetobacter bereziniae]NUG71435.1 hypothetical protein [Acinetobacter bereziniae]NUG81305.1 hypothetical protein [Acinetobacter bereziniae]
MGLKNVTRIEQQVHEKKWFQRFRNKIGATATAVGSYALVSSAHAADDLSAVGTAVTGQLTASQAIIISIFVVAATLTALIIGYRKLNKGANAA